MLSSWKGGHFEKAKAICDNDWDNTPSAFQSIRKICALLDLALATIVFWGRGFSSPKRLRNWRQCESLDVTKVLNVSENGLWSQTGPECEEVNQRHLF